MNTLVLELNRAAAIALRDELERAGYEFREVDHALFAAKGEHVNVVCYTSGKLVVQGKGSPDFRLQRLGNAMPRPKATLKRALIGADEAGKGDYFGPLVVAACALSPELEPFLDEVPLVDSKLLSDGQAITAADSLATVLPHEVIVIGPRRYNELYEQFGNLNKLLAWAHARAIAAVAQKSGVKDVLLDQFTTQPLVQHNLDRANVDVNLEMRTKAENNPAVAAASILARAGFLRGLKRLEQEFGVRLAKGAGSPVLKAGRELIAAKGRRMLDDVAKLHFKTTIDIGG
jgi:ribonuclease HIII